MLYLIPLFTVSARPSSSSSECMALCMPYGSRPNPNHDTHFQGDSILLLYLIKIFVRTYTNDLQPYLISSLYFCRQFNECMQLAYVISTAFCFIFGIAIREGSSLCCPPQVIFSGNTSQSFCASNAMLPEINESDDPDLFFYLHLGSASPSSVHYFYPCSQTSVVFLCFTWLP